MHDWDDAHWAQHDPDVEILYGGQWVVVQERTIIAHGTDPAKVRAEAAKILHCRPEELILCAVPHSDSWLADA